MPCWTTSPAPNAYANQTWLNTMGYTKEELPPLSTAPVIALTAELNPHEKLRAAGMDDYHLKPFTRESLYKKIYEIMAARQ